MLKSDLQSEHQAERKKRLDEYNYYVKQLELAIKDFSSLLRLLHRTSNDLAFFASELKLLHRALFKKGA